MPRIRTRAPSVESSRQLRDTDAQEEAMPNVSRDTADESISMFGLDVRLTNFEGGYTVCFESHSSDQDLGPLFEGLPDDECQFRRLGYVVAGTVEFRIGDRTETYTAGDAYYVPPGHVPIHHEGAQIVEFSPDRAARRNHRRGHGQCRARPASGPAGSGEVTTMSVFYQVSYRVGFHPWEDLAEHEPFANALARAVQARGAGQGAALRQGAGPRLRQRDLGRSPGRTGMAGHRRGQRAGGSGARRASASARPGSTCACVLGDVTRLRESAVGSGYDLVVDTGTFHGLTPAQRLDMGREVTSIAAEERDRDPGLLRPASARSASTWVHTSGRGGGVPRLADHRRHRCRHRPGPDRARVQVQRDVLPASSEVTGGERGCP